MRHNYLKHNQWTEKQIDGLLGIRSGSVFNVYKCTKKKLKDQFLATAKFLFYLDPDLDSGSAQKKYGSGSRSRS